MKLITLFLFFLYLTAANAEDRVLFTEIQVTNNESAVPMFAPWNEYRRGVFPERSPLDGFCQTQ